MKRILCRLAVIAASVVFIIALLFTSLQITINDEQWFYEEYRGFGLADVTGISVPEMTASIMKLIGYMEGGEEDIRITVSVNGKKTEMFNQKETEHMADVKNLYQGFKVFRNISFTLTVLAFAAVFYFMRREAPLMLARGFLTGGAVVTGIIMFIGIYALLDFSAFWTSFHHLFFTNELWLLNPRTDRMIWICPEELFSDIVVKMAGLFGAIIIVLVIISAGIILIDRRRRSTPIMRRTD